MGSNWIAIPLSILFFIVGLLVMLDQYLNTGSWLQLRDIHHETLALSSFALAVGILIGWSLVRYEKWISW